MRPSTLGKAVLAVLLSPLILVLGLGIAIFVLPIEAAHRIQKMRFCRKHLGDRYLVVSPRRGWYPFVVNNVAPELPGNVSLLWHSGRSPRDGGTPHPLIRLVSHEQLIGTKPLLVRVSMGGFQIVPLHQQLLPLKCATTKRDSAIRKQVHDLLTEARD